MENFQRVSLAELPFNMVSEVCLVSNQSSEMLEVLRHKNITIGTRLEVKKKFEFDNSLEIKLRQQPPVTISEQLAKNIFVKYDA
jgi:DtxR family Mn-dependent transcriptional regulator